MSAKKLSYAAAVALWGICAWEAIIIVVRIVQGRLADIPLVGSLLDRGETVDLVAPAVVLALVAWVLIEMVFHFRRVWRERVASRLFEVASQRASDSALMEGLAAVTPAAARAARRAEFMQENWSQPSTLREDIPAMAALDDAELANHYSVTKMYVWILPVVGFMGTAWGMLSAIGGFATALGETQEISSLADRLGQLVIPGLAEAFLITILALGGAILTHFWVTAMQSWDSDLLEKTNRATVAILERVPAGASDGTGPSSPILAEILSVLQRIQKNIDFSAAGENLIRAAQALGAASQQLSIAIERGERLAQLPYQITVKRGIPVEQTVEDAAS